ncbi:helix-turn-helix domain-containing protein [Paraburkholderia megapolitana]|uniref:helix-turn-helix domain-containing protein n=1 Tax=Paraburkholderia megapolitana TaxID=420953 RepID=UPI0038B81ECD
MDVQELMDAAKRKCGTLGAVAKAMDVNPNRLSEWRKGLYKPNATQIAQLAELAGLPIFQTVAEVECALEGDNARVWARALASLRAASVATTQVLKIQE